MNNNDKNLIRQMISAGRFANIQDLVIKLNEDNAKKKIKSMGEKWCCHKKHSPKKGNYGY